MTLFAENEEEEEEDRKATKRSKENDLKVNTQIISRILFARCLYRVE